MIEACRKHWSFQDLADTTELKILLFDKKGRYDMSSWPNFFIGVDFKGDTIGIIDNFSTVRYKKGMVLTFVPHDYGDNIEKALTLHPVFATHKKKEENRLYCSINKVYYGKLK